MFGAIYKIFHFLRPWATVNYNSLAIIYHIEGFFYVVGVYLQRVQPKGRQHFLLMLHSVAIGVLQRASVDEKHIGVSAYRRRRDKISPRIFFLQKMRRLFDEHNRPFFG